VDDDFEFFILNGTGAPGPVKVTAQGLATRVADFAREFIGAFDAAIPGPSAPGVFTLNDLMVNVALTWTGDLAIASGPGTASFQLHLTRDTTTEI
jgi:hypothetical protein